MDSAATKRISEYGDKKLRSAFFWLEAAASGIVWAIGDSKGLVCEERGRKVIFPLWPNQDAVSDWLHDGEAAIAISSKGLTGALATRGQGNIVEIEVWPTRRARGVLLPLSTVTDMLSSAEQGEIDSDLLQLRVVPVSYEPFPIQLETLIGSRSNERIHLDPAKGESMKRGSAWARYRYLHESARRPRGGAWFCGISSDTALGVQVQGAGALAIWPSPGVIDPQLAAMEAEVHFLPMSTLKEFFAETASSLAFRLAVFPVGKEVVTASVGRLLLDLADEYPPVPRK